MATQILAEVLEHTAARDTAWMVIVVLADEAGRETREAHCSTEFLMRRTHKSERAVRYALRQLEHELGEITTVRRGDGRTRFSVYRINLLTEKGATVAPFDRRKGATVAPFVEPERGQLTTEKGATSDTERGQPATDTYSGNYSVCPLLKDGKRPSDFPPEFESTWAAYPRRLGSNPKLQAFRCWQARRKEGDTAEAIRHGVERYRAHCEAQGKINTEFVMQAKRFFGPEREYSKPWPVQLGQPAPQARGQARKTFDEIHREQSQHIAALEADDDSRENAIPSTAKRVG